MAAVSAADDALHLCIYGDNRGSSRVHRDILRQAKALEPRLFVINGDVLKYDYGATGTPEAVLDDYREVFAAAENRLTLWPAAPGPVVFTAVGGHDEQFFLDPDVAAMADTMPGGRTAYEGTNQLGVQLYEAFSLDQMRLRVQPLPEIERPLPMSPYGDYLLIVGSGPRRDCALLFLYRSDRWAFRPDQIAWVDSVLTVLRRQSPQLPLIAVAHDWTWFFPDTLDDGSADGAYNAVREGSPEADAQQKRRLLELMLRHRVDVAVAADRHAYWAGVEGSLLRVNCGAAICKDHHGARVAADNLWLEVSQTDSSLRVAAHPVDPPPGCGLTPEAAAFGTVFEKSRIAGSFWQAIKP